MLLRCRSLRSPFFIIAFTCSAYLWRTFRLQLVALSGQQHHPPSLFWSNAPPPTPDDRTERPGSSDGNFSACLLVMDDNHFLIEWLAYHSFVMPLGHVILAVDPRSRSRPDGVVKRWESHMTIQVWDDHDYMSESERLMHERYVKQHFGPEIFAQPDLITHRARQRLFYYKCMQSMKEQRRGWVLLTDTDEYLHINYPTVRSLNLTSIAPAVSMHNSVGAFLREELQRPGNNLTSPCVQIPRLRYGAKESTSRQVQRQVPGEFNGSHFLTLRWRHHAAPDNRFHNRISKTLIDLHRVKSQQLRPVTSVHRPIRELCGHRRLYILPKDQVLLINHYLGSKEQYQFRNDSRVGKERSDETFARAAALDQGENDDVRPWIQGFVQKHGVKNAQKLLAGVGMPTDTEKSVPVSLRNPLGTMDTSSVLNVSHSIFSWTHLDKLQVIDDVTSAEDAQRFGNERRWNRFVFGLVGLTVLDLLHQGTLSCGLRSCMHVRCPGSSVPSHEFNASILHQMVNESYSTFPNYSRALASSTFVHCRITALNVMLAKKETKAAGYFSQEEFVCIPIRSENGRESDHYLTIVGNLEKYVTIPQLRQAKKGTLLATIRTSESMAGGLILPDDFRGFRVIESIPPNWTQFQQRTIKASAMGKQTLAIIRVSTKDSAPPMSLEAIRLHFAASRQSAAAQYKLCSFSKFQLQFIAGHDVKLPNSIREFSSGSQLLDVAAAKLSRDLKISSMTDLADKVVFCLAPGTKGWVATAGVNFYRLVVNGDWCLSLSVAMHELGHTVGLIHSGAGPSAYGDESGYMGYGDKAVKWPRKCFNALNHWQLSWYQDRHRVVNDAKSLTGPNYVTLAAFVDYQKAGINKKVILNIEDTYYMQYNRAKAFNQDTEEDRDKVVVIQDTAGYSRLLKGMDVNEGISLRVRGTQGKLVIKVCHRVDATGDEPDYMVLSVSMNRAYCGEWHELHRLT